MTSQLAVSTQLDSLFRSRFHGAVNIRGIRYQILFSVLKLLELTLTVGADFALTLEGLEDVDVEANLKGIRVGTEYIQVKSSADTWKWNQLKGPIAGFLEVSRADMQSRFTLVTSFEPTGDIAKLANISSLGAGERTRVQDKFRSLCRQVGASTKEADQLAETLTIVPLSESEILERLTASAVKAFDFGSAAVTVYLLALMAKCLEWAEKRQSVQRKDLELLRASIGEALSREAEFQAYGKRLVEQVDWATDESELDFLEGKGTRPGHISARIDVDRPYWVDRVDEVIHQTKVCVLRSPSGQGKSTLMFRYAHDRWPSENVFVLRLAETPEQVEQVGSYLAFRANLGLPILLLVDDAGWQRRLWPEVVRQCVAKGIRVLVTVRAEDWNRYARSHMFTFEIVEPVLELAEAREIYAVLRRTGRVHAAVPAADWAYERIGEPHLLMEYIYLLTHGRMLEDRLRDQIMFMSEHEDPAKIEVLRRVSLAETLGTPIDAEKLVRSIPFNRDPGLSLSSLRGEYLRLENGVASGLHWVRSDHLTRILHEGYPSITSTILATLDAVPAERLANYVAGALSHADTDQEQFGEELVEWALSRPKDILGVLEGLFEGGERLFFFANRAVFDEAFAEHGPAGPYLLSMDTMPLTQTNLLRKFAEVTGERGDNYRRLGAIAERITAKKRGLDYCRKFLGKVAERLTPEGLEAGGMSWGTLLDWFSLCNIQLPGWGSFASTLVSGQLHLDQPVEAFCNIAQGIYRYDPSLYETWYLENAANIHAYLRLHTGCVELSVSDERLSLTLVINPASSEKPHNQIVSRLELCRSALPFCKRYGSKAVWPLPFGLQPSADDTTKDIPKENLPFRSDATKNSLWTSIVETAYQPDSYYRFQEAWYGLRKAALQFVDIVQAGFSLNLEWKQFDYYRGFKNGQVLEDLMVGLKASPSPPAQTPPEVKEALKKSLQDWVFSFRNFFHQVFDYLKDPSAERTGFLAVHNYKDSLRRLPELHSAFEQLFELCPDYFAARDLDKRELERYGQFTDILEVRVLETPSQRLTSTSAFLAARRAQKRRSALERLERALEPIRTSGMRVDAPKDILVEHPLRYLPLLFEVRDPCDHFGELFTLVNSLNDLRDLADFFCLIPFTRSGRFLADGYRVSSTQIEKWCEGNLEGWEAAVPQALPREIWALLPSIPLQVPSRYSFQQAATGVWASLDSLARWWAALEPIRASRHPFDQRLVVEHQSEVTRLLSEFRQISSQALLQLEGMCADFDYTSVYETVHDVLMRCTNANSVETLIAYYDQLISDEVNFTQSVGELLTLLLDMP